MSWISQIESDGFAVIRGVYDRGECGRLAGALEAALAACADQRAALRRTDGTLYGARNLLDLFPRAVTLWQRAPLTEVLAAVLGPRLGLVRGLYFDKPPRSTWSLPWHRDLTVAVRDHSLPTDQFRSPTTKAGVPHLEAPDDVLRQMLTLRIHVDAATAENGPLQVIPGTHVGRDTEALRRPEIVYAQAGDVLAMRPLLLHSSGPSSEGATLHRRVIHLEFAGCPSLPDGLQWHWFLTAEAA